MNDCTIYNINDVYMLFLYCTYGITNNNVISIKL